MGKKSRKEARRLEKLQKAREFNQNTPRRSGGVLINADVVQLPKEGLIPNSAAENFAIIEPAEKSLAIYLLSLCLNHKQISEIDKVDAKALVHKLFCLNTTNKSKAQQCLIKDKVENGGKYAFLYQGQSPEVEILEIVFRNDGRIFGYFSENIFNVVAVRTNHIKID